MDSALIGIGGVNSSLSTFLFLCLSLSLTDGPTDLSFYLSLSLSVFLSFSVVDSRLHGPSHRKRIIPIWIGVSGPTLTIQMDPHRCPGKFAALKLSSIVSLSFPSFPALEYFDACYYPGVPDLGFSLSGSHCYIFFLTSR